MTLQNRIERLSKILSSDIYLLSKTTDKNIILRFENIAGEVFEFSGTSIVETIVTAEEYVKNEINAGTLKETEEKQDDIENEEINNEKDIKVESEKVNENQQKLPF